MKDYKLRELHASHTLGWVSFCTLVAPATGVCWTRVGNVIIGESFFVLPEHPSRNPRLEILASGATMSRALLALAFVAAVDAFNTSPMHCMPLRTTRPAVSRDLRAPVSPKRATTAVRMQTEEDKV